MPESGFDSQGALVTALIDVATLSEAQRGINRRLKVCEDAGADREARLRALEAQPGGEKDSTKHGSFWARNQMSLVLVGIAVSYLMWIVQVIISVKDGDAIPEPPAIGIQYDVESPLGE